MPDQIRIVTAADSVYFTRLLGLLGSLVRYHNPKDFSVAVYDIGLHADQLRTLSKILWVDVIKPDKVNPFVTTLMKKHEAVKDRMAPGLYTWKPIAVKTEMDKFGQILWMDAGTVACSNLRPLWEHTKNVGYFFVGCNTISYQTPKPVIEKLKVTPETLAKQALNSSTMGITEHIRHSFFLPAYVMAKDIELFRDDGSAAGGDRAGRHDQTVFSIIAANSGLYIHPTGDHLELITDSGTAIHSIVADDQSKIRLDTLVYQCRGNSNWNGDLDFIKNLLNI